MILFAPALALGQNSCYYSQAITSRVGFNNLAAVVPGAQVTVSPGPIYSSASSSTPLTQPVTADAYGNYNFCAAYGTVQTVTVTGGGMNTLSYFVTFPTVLGGASLTANNTFTGNNIFNGTVTGSLGFTATGLSGFTAGGVTTTSPASTYQAVSAATNYGANVGSTTIVASAPYTGEVTIMVSAVQSLLGVGCGAGTNSVTFTLAFTAPGGTAETPALPSQTISANGTLDSNSYLSSSGGQAMATIAVKTGTSISFSTTSSLGSAGCSPVPQYTAYAKAIF